MSGRKLSDAQRLKWEVAIDNEAMKSSHLIEGFLNKAKTDSKPSELHKYSDE